MVCKMESPGKFVPERIKQGIGKASPKKSSLPESQWWACSKLVAETKIRLHDLHSFDMGTPRTWFGHW